MVVLFCPIPQAQSEAGHIKGGLSDEQESKKANKSKKKDQTIIK